MNRLNRRAGPHKASFDYPMWPSSNDLLIFAYPDGKIMHIEVNHGLGEQVLALLGFVRGPEFWFRRVTERAG
jgi:hypothetical protein